MLKHEGRGPSSPPPCVSVPLHVFRQHSIKGTAVAIGVGEPLILGDRVPLSECGPRGRNQSEKDEAPLRRRPSSSLAADAAQLARWEPTFAPRPVKAKG